MPPDTTWLTHRSYFYFMEACRLAGLQSIHDDGGPHVERPSCDDEASGNLERGDSCS